MNVIPLYQGIDPFGVLKEDLKRVAATNSQVDNWVEKAQAKVATGSSVLPLATKKIRQAIEATEGPLVAVRLTAHAPRK